MGRAEGGAGPAGAVHGGGGKGEWARLGRARGGGGGWAKMGKEGGGKKKAFPFFLKSIFL
jgi:hypothetical protein